MKRPLRSAVLCLLAQTVAIQAADENFYWPGPVIGPAATRTSPKEEKNHELSLSNSAVDATFRTKQGRFCLVRLASPFYKDGLAWNDPNLFTLRLKDESLPSSRMSLMKSPEFIDLKAEPGQVNLAARSAGKSITATFGDDATGITVHWRAILRDGSNYLRQEIAVTSTAAVEIQDIEMIHTALPGAKMIGFTDGAPIGCGNWFLGLEHPMAKNNAGATNNGTLAAGDVTAALPRNFSLTPGVTWTLSTAIGIAPAGQLRRAFAYYLQRERAHPYRQYWHYNSWYDLNINRNDLDDPLKRMNEAQCLEVIRSFDANLYQKHGIGLNGFVWDDGWDDWNTLWQFHKGFPNGFAKLNEAARPQGAKMGAWLSPWGGYGRSHAMRVKLGNAQGYETNSAGLSLGGPKYRAVFRDTCLKMIRDYQQDYFKFDGIGTGTWATGAPASISADLDGLVSVARDLRRANPAVFINCTVGTWASPYWTFFADSIWRQGEDTAFAGKGNPRERWINYKDGIVHRRFAATSPLFPINSLMYHGLVLGPVANPAQMPAPAKDPDSFRHEIQMMAGYASGLGELYISPGLMTDEAWAMLAECIRWGRANQRLLADSHWIGGNPEKHEIYGFAAWNPIDGGAITLRNPDDKPQSITIDLAKTWELPTAVTGDVQLRSPWSADAAKPAIKTNTRQPLTLTLQPFEVMNLKASNPN